MQQKLRRLAYMNKTSFNNKLYIKNWETNAEIRHRPYLHENSTLIICNTLRDTPQLDDEYFEAMRDLNKLDRNMGNF